MNRITVRDGKFWDGDTEWVPRGYNTYALQWSGPDATQPDWAYTRQYFDRALETGCNVIRCWLYNEEAWHGMYNDDGGSLADRGLNFPQWHIVDELLNMAERYGVRLYPPLWNWRAAFGGAAGDPGIWDDHRYWTHIETFIKRYTGRPGFFAVDVMNEPPPSFLNEIDEAAVLIKSYDPGMLVGPGTEGQGYLNYGSSTLGDWEAVNKLDNIDFATAHLYPYDVPIAGGSWDPADFPQLLRTLKQRSAGKPLVVGEWSPMNGGTMVLGRTEATFDAFEAAGVGHLFWDLQVDNSQGFNGPKTWRLDSVVPELIGAPNMPTEPPPPVVVPPVEPPPVPEFSIDERTWKKLKRRIGRLENRVAELEAALDVHEDNPDAHHA